MKRALLPLLACLLAVSATAQERQRPSADADAAKPEAAPALPIPPESHVDTKHDWTAGSRVVHYTASAGILLVNDEKEKPIGSMSYVAYTEDGVASHSRPVTFLYNGGPGSATIWLHMGSVGPVRVITDSPKATGPAPYQWVPNQYSLIDQTDLVFVDAPMTGFSRLVGKGTAKDFAGVDQDVKAFENFIVRYLTLNQRWDSPKYLFGESYGTPRSAALVAALNNDGVEFNGVVLLSSILNYNMRDAGYDISPKTYLPSYAAIAWYFNKVPHVGTMQEFVEKARQFSRNVYAPALDQGDQLSAADFDSVATQLAAFTGLSVDYIKDSKLRIAPTRFRAELMRHEQQILGRYDARFEGADVDAAGSEPGYDPADTGISGAFTGAFHQYLQTELNDKTTQEYHLSADSIGEWDWKHHPSGSRGPADPRPDTVLDLADAMRKNPHLRVFSANGWFDLATPFFGTEHDLAQMMLPDNIKSNVQFGYYPSGHMVYLNVDALKLMHADLEKWYAAK